GDLLPGLTGLPGSGAEGLDTYGAQLGAPDRRPHPPFSSVPVCPSSRGRPPARRPSCPSRGTHPARAAGRGAPSPPGADRWS
ncbi:hypothetical protein AB0P49_20290, partial [Streptomyces niveus]